MPIFRPFDVVTAPFSDVERPLVVRTAKIATIEADILKQIGHINPQDTEDVLAQLRDHLPSSIR